MEDKGWLKDVVNGTAEEEQFRCNQVFALSMPYTMLSKEQGRRLLAAVRERLYTPVGLRTLDPAVSRSGTEPTIRERCGPSH